MRLVHIRWLWWRWTGASAFVMVFRREINLAVIVTVVQWWLIAKFHRLEDKIIIVELEWSAAEWAVSVIDLMEKNWMKREDQVWCFSSTC